MKKISTLVVCTVALTSFLFINHAHAQTGPIAKLEFFDDSTHTLMKFDSAFFDSGDLLYETSPSELNGFNFYNVGDEPLTFTITSSNPDFHCDEGSYTLPGSDNDFYYMFFRPTKIGIATGVVTITTNDPNQPEIIFNVVGYGLKPPVDPSTQQFNLIVGTQVTKHMIVRNTTANRAKFTIIPQGTPALPPIIISKGGLILDPENEFVLDAGDSTTIDFLFDYSDPNNGPSEYNVDVEIECYPLHFAVNSRSALEIYIYKAFIVTGVFPLATINSPSPISKDVPVSAIDSLFFDLQNYGNTELHYSIDTDSLLNETQGIRLLSTGFEEFMPGIAQRQSGWSELEYVFYVEDNHDWTVETTNPFVGSKHLRCISNNFNYGAELFAPEPEGNATIIDMMVNLDLGSGSQWVFKAATEDYSLKKFIVGSDGSLRVLNEPSTFEAQPILGQLPTGYFNLRFILNNTTNEFTITIDGVSVYTGVSNATKFINFSMGKDEQVAGSIMDVDNFRWIDGSENIRLLAVEPEMGSVQPMEIQDIKLKIDTRNSDPGTYSEIFTIRSNDVVNPVVFIPVTIVVKPNELPVLIGNFTETMFSGETKSFTFLATDADDSLVLVSDHNFYGSGSHGEPAGYVSSEATDSGNKSLTYTISTGKSPYIGFLSGTIQANDGRGGITSKFFNVTILPFRENDFILTNFKNGNVVANFTDTVTLDVAHPDIDRLTIRANFPLEITGNGMLFKLDGVEINRDRSQPYYLTPSVLPKLNEGYHTLLASSYYQDDSYMDQYIIETRQTIVHVINSATITSYQVVNKDGVKIMDLTNGSVIDLSKTGSDINIIAMESVSSVRSVKFVLNNVTARIDNGSPYALGGTAIGGDTFWKAKPGTYTLSATPYLKYFAWGPKGKTLTVNFKVVNGTIPATAIARIANSNEEEQVREVIDRENILSIYPVPVKDELHIELHESVKGNVAINIMNAQGQAIHTKTGNADELRKYSISTVQLGMSQGIYFVIVNRENGARIVKKFIKE